MSTILNQNMTKVTNSTNGDFPHLFQNRFIITAIPPPIKHCKKQFSNTEIMVVRVVFVVVASDMLRYSLAKYWSNYSVGTGFYNN